MKRFVFIALALAGCLDVPSEKAPACSSNADCNNAAGEVCDEGVCYGDPPTGIYAGTISPPSEREDLVPFEMATLDLPEDGWLGDLAFEAPVTFSGRVEAYCAAPMNCDAHLSLDATITITRPSLFAGGPAFRAVVTSDGDLPSGESFHVLLPRSRDNDPPYTITIVPNQRNMPTAQIAAAELVPPLRTQMTIKDNASGKNIVLGEGPLAIIGGKVSYGTGGLADYRVVALGRWEPNGPLTEVSTVSYTTADGHYELALADNIAGPVEIVAKSLAVSPKPTLHLTGIDATKSSLQNLPLPTSIGNINHQMVEITGNDGSGKVGPIAGARVSVRAEVKPDLGMGVTLTALSETTTDSMGRAQIEMFDGQAFTTAYRLRIVPPPGSTVGAVFDEPVARGPLVAKQLVDRVALGGNIVDSSGNALGGVAITAHPALRFTWSLPDEAQQFLSEIPAASTTSTNDGAFVVYVDPIVAETWGSYELVFEQSAPNDQYAMNRSSNWRVDDIQLPRDSTITHQTLPTITIPDAAFVHGRVIDADGLEVEGAELKIFRIDGNTSICGEVTHAPPTCPIPADLHGRGASDADGLVRLSLPRP